MEEMHLKQVDLVDAIGGKSRVSEILNRKRKLKGSNVDYPVLLMKRFIMNNPSLYEGDKQMINQNTVGGSQIKNEQWSTHYDKAIWLCKYFDVLFSIFLD